MSVIVTRSGKGSPLTHAEVDANFTNLNTDKLETADVTAMLGVTIQDYSANLDEYAAVNPTAAGLALLDDADAAAQLVTLGAAPLVSPTFTGTPAAPTAALGTNTTQLATTAFVQANTPQVQSFSAVPSANTLIISAGTLTLDFRSATLGSGTITRVSGDPADLVISSGSTLGTVNGVASRIAVIAMNNAGTIELAATNIAGGVNLDETGLISTTAEGGAGGADTANVVYSTTARTDLAYRVLGYIESTQATAGTWATAPSTIQGAGGQAVVGLPATARRWVDVVGSRAKATSYTNTSRYDRDVSISCSASNSPAYITCTQNGVGVYVGYGQPGTSQVLDLYATIPPGASYQFDYAGTVNGWVERG